METRLSTSRGVWVVSSSGPVRSDVPFRLGEVRGESLSVEVGSLSIALPLVGDLNWLCFGLLLAVSMLCPLLRVLALVGGLLSEALGCGWPGSGLLGCCCFWGLEVDVLAVPLCAWWLWLLGLFGCWVWSLTHVSLQGQGVSSSHVHLCWMGWIGRWKSSRQFLFRFFSGQVWVWLIRFV